MQFVVVGVAHDLPAAIEEGKAGLRKRAGLVREKAGFPLIRGMHFVVTNVLTQVHHEGDTSTTTATLARLVSARLRRRPDDATPSPLVGQVPTHVIVEHDVVFCEGY
ncbi:MAG TPA: hypothetical protein VHJ39_12565 [Solirubrobacteraceae bacterium]|nr:hypothetical protein [Solirubrobacteraceae bacterium]